MANEIVTALQVQEIDGYLLVDSRLIAERLGIQHEVLIRTINKYLTELQGFGVLRFENGKLEPGATGRPQRFCYLNEDQATLLMTMSRNTAQVVQCKMELVAAFKKAKSIINTVIPAQNDRIRELELELKIREIDNTMVTLHGRETVLALRGYRDQVVETKIVVTEIVNPVTGCSAEILSAEQLKQVVRQRTGQKLPSLKWFVERLRAEGRDDLLVPVTRSQTTEYLSPIWIDEALDVVYGRDRQRLIGE